MVLRLLGSQRNFIPEIIDPDILVLGYPLGDQGCECNSRENRKDVFQTFLDEIEFVRSTSKSDVHNNYCRG